MIIAKLILVDYIINKRLDIIWLGIKKTPKKVVTFPGASNA